uniref:Uncharacterized protein n=1 Tax=Rhizophora mucronata TaxID=61149 RepID=A0A2P2JV62_RHIMU
MSVARPRSGTAPLSMKRKKGSP